MSESVQRPAPAAPPPPPVVTTPPSGSADAIKQTVVDERPAQAGPSLSPSVTTSPSVSADAGKRTLNERQVSAGPSSTPIATTPPSAGADAIKQALEEMRASLPKFQEVDAAAANGLKNFLERANDPVRLNNAEFQHRIAYAAADVQRMVGPFERLGDDARERLRDLSVAAPGLVNPRAGILLSEANSTADSALRNDIRRTAIEIGKQADQNTPQIVSLIEALENRVRLSPAPAATQPQAAATSAATGQNSPPLAAGLDANGRPPGQPANSETTAVNQDAARARNDQQHARQQQPTQESGGQIGAGAAIASSMLRGFQKLGEAIPPPPWEAMTTNFGDRLKAFEDRRQAGSDQKIIAGVEASGAKALTALQGFSNNEGAVMMARVNQAARSDPSGIEGVLAEMRPGGKYADLRQQFNGAISNEKGLAAAYDKAVEAVSQYAYDRKAASPVIARSPDAVAVTARLEAFEQNVGERMARIPSLSDGKSMIEDLRKQAAEVFQAVADGIRNLFQRVGASASPSPSP